MEQQEGYTSDRTAVHEERWQNVIEEEEPVTQRPERRAFYGGDEHSRPSACARLASTGHWKASVAAAQ